MLHKNLILSMLIVLLVALVGCSTTQASVVEPEPEQNSAPPVEGGRAIVVADISEEPTKKIERFQPLADYLAENLSEHGITYGEVKIAPDMETMIAWMEAGEVDLFYDSPFPAMMISDQSGAQPIMRRWKDGVSEYGAVIFVRADSGLESLEDLQGKMVGLENASSTSGYMLPLAHIKSAGFKTAEKPSANAVVADDMIGYTFTNDDANTIQWVASQEIAAGAVDNVSFELIPEEIRKDLAILAETEKAARQVVLAQPGLEPAVIEAVTELMSNLDETPEGQELLVILKTDQFDEFPDGAEATFDHMRELFTLVNAE